MLFHLCWRREFTINGQIFSILILSVDVLDNKELIHVNFHQCYYFKRHKDRGISCCTIYLLSGKCSTQLAYSQMFECSFLEFICTSTKTTCPHITNLSPYKAGHLATCAKELLCTTLSIYTYTVRFFLSVYALFMVFLIHFFQKKKILLMGLPKHVRVKNKGKKVYSKKSGLILLAKIGWKFPYSLKKWGLQKKIREIKDAPKNWKKSNV